MLILYTSADAGLNIDVDADPNDIAVGAPDGIANRSNFNKSFSMV